VARGGAALSGAARIHDPDAAVALELGHVRMPVHDHGATRKGGAEPLLASDAGTGVVHEADAHAIDFHDASLGQRRLQFRLIHVPGYRLHGPACGKRLERADRDDVAGVKHEVRILQQAQTLPWQSAGAARQVGVRDDGDERQGYFLRL
jgi:hypothetical protein